MCVPSQHPLMIEKLCFQLVLGIKEHLAILLIRRVYTYIFRGVLFPYKPDLKSLESIVRVVFSATGKEK